MSKVVCNSNELILKSGHGQLEKLILFLQNSIGDYKLQKSGFNRILLCISEAVTNAISHGNKYDKNKVVKVVSSLIDNDLNITISDQGKGFDYKNIADPTRFENLKKEEGRGLHIIKFYSKEISFNNSGSTISIKFDLSDNTVL